MQNMQKFTDEDDAPVWIDVSAVQYTRTYQASDGGEEYTVTRVETADYTFMLKITDEELAKRCGWGPYKYLASVASAGS